MHVQPGEAFQLLEVLSWHADMQNEKDVEIAPEPATTLTAVRPQTKCVNCKGAHAAYSQMCDVLKKTK